MMLIARMLRSSVVWIFGVLLAQDARLDVGPFEDADCLMLPAWPLGRLSLACSLESTRLDTLRLASVLARQQRKSEDMAAHCNEWELSDRSDHLPRWVSSHVLKRGRRRMRERIE